MIGFKSPIEERFAAALFAELALRPAALSIHPQAPVGKYAADLLLCLGQKRVVVECDGHDFHERTPEQAERDKSRDRFMVAQGLTVMRFTGRELTRDAGKCAQEVLSFLFGFDVSERTKKVQARRDAEARRIRARNEKWKAESVVGGQS